MIVDSKLKKKFKILFQAQHLKNNDHIFGIGQVLPLLTAFHRGLAYAHNFEKQKKKFLKKRTNQEFNGSTCEVDVVRSKESIRKESTKKSKKKSGAHEICD